MLDELISRLYLPATETSRYPRIDDVIARAINEGPTTDEDQYHIKKVRSIVLGISTVAVVEMSDDPNLRRSTSESFAFYLPFFASLDDAGLANAFVDHLYRTTHVSDAPDYDPDDRFGVLRYAKR